MNHQFGLQLLKRGSFKIKQKNEYGKSRWQLEQVMVKVDY